jgi:hypothetical protein
VFHIYRTFGLSDTVHIQIQIQIQIRTLGSESPNLALGLQLLALKNIKIIVFMNQIRIYKKNNASIHMFGALEK